MTLMKFLETSLVCGAISDSFYNIFLEKKLETCYEYKDVELRSSELRFLNELIKLNSGFWLGSGLYSIRYNLRQVYKNDKEYDEAINILLRMNKEYENSKYKGVIVRNLLDNSNNYKRIKRSGDLEKDLRFFKFCSYISDISVKYRGEDCNFYGAWNNEEDTNTFNLMNDSGNVASYDLVLAIINKDNSLRLYNDRQVKTKEELASFIKRELENDLYIAVVKDVDIFESIDW